MNLEQIEQDTLAYLSQSSNPLVRISTVHQHVTSKSDTISISLEEYSDFLESHDLMKVTDPFALAEDDETFRALGEAGLPTNPCVILESRVPSMHDLGTTIVEQLVSMTDALAKALKEARGTGDSVRGHEIYETLERVESLKKRVIDHIKSS